MRSARILRPLLLTAALLALAAPAALAQPLEIPTFDFIRPAETPQEGLQTMQLLLLLTVLTLAPAIIILCTSFTRIIVVFGFIRTALGLQQTPPNQVLIGLALFLTAAVMMPTFSEINQTAVQPYLAGEIDQVEAIERGALPLKAFMLRQTREADLGLMLEVSGQPAPEGPEDVSFLTVVPAFALSELKTAFTMGFLIYLPFIIIDLITASLMMSLGMMMVPPTLISLPFKVLLFVLVDGWHLVVESLVRSFTG
ncbi:flagellar type III secretion system pore protein FliP [Symbiobacterium thermophilum]|uniref:Flagellar biosynthetic protein FliP n=1 Tax=Symbiobacterium thermophilum (strain DSM 24528 / JCM 14929 / IAM 14863 / T) TaxID=292459 RepID=Q67K26_SYMTH|nr:flagellar type III secretion system pore protein FliP [Symbiobacterium thermophilum]BAD41974.1 flagellar biosynthesis protein [Symbiobacterium thermophilum IAM 14863]